MIYALTALLFAALAAGDCNADNCLRALRATQTPGRLQAAQSFCATFTKQSVPATAIPSFAANACVPNQVGNRSFRISSACSCIATSTPSATSSTPTNTGAPCAVVSSLAAAQRAISPSATPTVPAQLAHDCLNSVPLGKESALELVDAIEPYLEWQSDSAYLKNPPPTYFYPPLDIFGKLASVKTNLQNNVYANEYTFQEDLYQVFAPAHDGHYILYPDALTKAFEWGRQRSLVSISSDGKQTPQIYVYEDVTSSPKTASIVKEINGIDAATYVAKFAYTAAFNQDADAAYNTMFYEKAFEAGGIGRGYFSSNGRVRYIYPGASTTFTFANGTILTLDNVAHVKGDFTGVTDGASYYQEFCTGPHPSSASAIDAADAAIVAPGYPAPVITTNDSIVSGYYLDGEGFEDVAVLSYLAFESESPVEFQEVTQKFIAEALAAGKTKIVIDLSANGGGYILQGYDSFRQFFPQIVQEDYTRFRENEYLLTIAKAISDSIPADYNPATASQAVINDYETFFNYRYDYNLTEKPFLSFDDKFSPHYHEGDPYTNIVRWNLNDPETTSNATNGFGTDITGYGSRTNFTQPFKAENIVMLYDGYCASTCTLFSEWMRLQGGVKSIAMGGRPSSSPIQAVGGIKGAQIFAFSDIYAYAQDAITKASPAQVTTLNKLTNLPINRSSSSGVNLRDNILPGNLNDGLPAQYVVEEADCRLYYTLDMVNDVTALWKGAAAAAFNGAPCVAGSGLKKRDGEAELEMKRAPAEAALDHMMRREVFERMESEKADPLFRAKYGKKIID